jgi:hypothetical protein
VRRLIDCRLIRRRCACSPTRRHKGWRARRMRSTVWLCLSPPRSASAAPSRRRPALRARPPKIVPLRRACARRHPLQARLSTTRHPRSEGPTDAGVASFYPTVQLNGTIGLVSLDIRKLWQLSSYNKWQDRVSRCRCLPRAASRACSNRGSRSNRRVRLGIRKP